MTVHTNYGSVVNVLVMLEYLIWDKKEVVIQKAMFLFIVNEISMKGVWLPHRDQFDYNRKY